MSAIANIEENKAMSVSFAEVCLLPTVMPVQSCNCCTLLPPCQQQSAARRAGDSLEICVHCKGVPTAPYKETAMAILACIVVACSPRLDTLDLRMDWYSDAACAENLLVSLLRLAP